MKTKEAVKAIQNEGLKERPKMIYQEKHIKYGDSENGMTNCQRIHHCSCDCNYIKCNVFFG